MILNSLLSLLFKTDRQTVERQNSALYAIKWICLLLTIIFACSWVIWGLMTPRLGDDILYTRRYFDNLRFYNHFVSILANIYGIWISHNARMADHLMGLWFVYVPRPLLALIIGCSVVLTFRSILFAAKAICGNFMRLAVIYLVILIALPWWQINYYVIRVFSFVYQN